jgi:membrane protease subunit HflC
MTSFVRGLIGVVIVVVALALYFSVFIVDQTEQVLVLRFGDPVRVINAPDGPVANDTSASKPGLYYKLPFIDNVVYFEKRILDLDSPPLEIIASDQKRLVVDAFSRYKIVNPLLFYQKVGTVSGASSRLSSFLQSAVRRVLGDASFSDLVRDRRAGLMTLIKQQVDQESRDFGIEIVDVKIRSADLPPENSQAIYQRMQTERQRQATEIRAEGEQEARTIRAEADRQATVTVAEANGEASRLQGDGEAQRNRIFAQAYSQDAAFFVFYRSMLAYQAALQPGTTRLVISPDSDFFRYFGSPQGVPSAGSQPAAPGGK